MDPGSSDLRAARDAPSWPRGPSTGAVVAVALALVIGVAIGRAAGGEGARTAPREPSIREADRQGPRRSVAGVPVGYPRSEAGAVSALLNYSVVLSGLVLRPGRERSAAVGTIATESFAPELALRLGRARSQAAHTALGRGLRAGARTVYRGAPLGYRVVRYGRGEAVIEAWAFGVVANDAGLGPHMTFATSTSTLRWEHGDWKLADTRSRPGPTPAVAAEPSGSAGFVELLGRLRGLRYAP